MKNKDEFKFIEANFKDIFPNSPMLFGALSKRCGHLEQTMRVESHQRLVNFLYINDIIRVVEKSIKENRSPNRKHTANWKYFLENDIQEYLDNKHEQSQNED